MITSLYGAIRLIVDQNHDVIGARDARVLTSLSCLLLISHNNDLSRILLTFKHTTTTGVPVVAMILLFVSMFALACRDLFGDKLIDSYTGDPYFDNFSNSIATCFRMCFGWYGIMYQAVDETTEAAQIWCDSFHCALLTVCGRFTTYAFVMLLFGFDLLVGVILSLQAEAQSIPSMRLFSVFRPLSEFSSEVLRKNRVKRLATRV